MPIELDDAVADVLRQVHAGTQSTLPPGLHRLVRHAQGTGATLQRAGHTHTTHAASAVQVAWKRDEMYRDALWLLFQHDGQWSLAGQTSDDAVAKWFLMHPHNGVPTFETLPSDDDVQALAAELFDMANGTTPRPADGPVAALTAPVDDASLVLTIGAVRVLASAGRGMVELAWVEADDPEWTEESRWAVVAQTDTGWAVQSVAYLGGLRSMLENAGLTWPEATG